MKVAKGCVNKRCVCYEKRKSFRSHNDLCPACGGLLEIVDKESWEILDSDIYDVDSNPVVEKMYEVMLYVKELFEAYTNVEVIKNTAMDYGCEVLDAIHIVKLRIKRFIKK